MNLSLKYKTINLSKQHWRHPVNNVLYYQRMGSLIEDVYYEIKDLPFQLHRYNPTLTLLLYENSPFRLKQSLQESIKAL